MGILATGLNHTAHSFIHLDVKFPFTLKKSNFMIDFPGSKISSDTGFLLLREMDERFDIIGPMSGWLKDPRSPVHTRHSLVQMIRQRVYHLDGLRGLQRRQPSPNRSFALASARATKWEQANPCSRGWRMTF
jgi:hypothetical protein